jgi:hypothetical protein
MAQQIFLKKSMSNFKRISLTVTQSLDAYRRKDIQNNTTPVTMPLLLKNKVCSVRVTSLSYLLQCTVYSLLSVKLMQCSKQNEATHGCKKNPSAIPVYKRTM